MEACKISLSLCFAFSSTYPAGRCLPTLTHDAEVRISPCSCFTLSESSGMSGAAERPCATCVCKTLPCPLLNRCEPALLGLFPWWAPNSLLTGAQAASVHWTMLNSYCFVPAPHEHLPLVHLQGKLSPVAGVSPASNRG